MNKADSQDFKLYHYLVALVLIVLGSPNYPAQERHSIEGVVMESGSDRPLDAVKISASLSGVQVSGITDPRGRFKIEIPRPGRYWVVPSLKGFVYARPARVKVGREAGVWVQIAEGRPVPRVELRMAKPGTIVGKVLTATGETLPGGVASVRLLQFIYDTSGRRTLENVPGLNFGFAGGGSFVRMDDRGEYRFYDVPPGDYYVGIFDGGRANGGSMFYPGTPDETRALPVQVNSGEEVRLNAVILPPQRGTDVRLHFPNPAELQIAQTTVLQSSRFFISSRRRSVDGEDEITFPFAPGHYDLFVSAIPSASSRTVSDALFGVISLDVGETPVDRQVVMSRGMKVSGSATLVNEAGVRSAVPLYPPRGRVECRLKLDSEPSLVFGGGPVCLGAQFPPGTYHLELGEIPSDQYVQSVTIGTRDVLAEGIQLQGDVDLQIVLATPGAILEGVVKDAVGEKLSDAVVVLVPDQPYTLNGGPLYRSTTSDVSGNFELRGVAPGNYHLFAWPDLEGAAYRNAEFMRKYEDKGKPVRIEKGSRSIIEVTSVE